MIIQRNTVILTTLWHICHVSVMFSSYCIFAGRGWADIFKHVFKLANHLWDPKVKNKTKLNQFGYNCDKMWMFYTSHQNNALKTNFLIIFVALEAGPPFLCYCNLSKNISCYYKMYQSANDLTFGKNRWYRNLLKKLAWCKNCMKATASLTKNSIWKHLRKHSRPR